MGFQKSTFSNHIKEVRLLYVLLSFVLLTACDLSAESRKVDVDSANAINAFKAKLNVEPTILWKRSTDISGSVITVTVEFYRDDVKEIVEEELRAISREIIIEAYDPTPDKIVVLISTR